MTTTITLESMRFHAYHGVMEQERTIGGDFIADVSYTIDTMAAETDSLNDTISYADVYDIVNKEMMQPAKLIEHVAFRIKAALTGHFPQMCDLTVKVSKLHPPINGEVGCATVKV